MDFAYFIPITLFICIVVAIKVVVDARVRRRIAETNPSEEAMKAMIAADELSRKLSALKWGLVLTMIGIAFGIIDGANLSSEAPGAWGILFAAAGLGLLAYHGIANRFR
jgi:hypothetical protein